MTDNTIILDLTNNEYDDRFVKANDSNVDSSSQFWQNEAKIKFVEMLNTNRAEAKNYKQFRKNNENKIFSTHNAIFINGGRGAGKTVFLHNIESMWEDSKSEDLSDLYFVETIDPTLLIEQDNFSNVLIAELYNAVEKKIKITNKDSKYFYNALKVLANSIGNRGEKSSHTGIDKILQYRSGIQIEKFFHDYVQTCIEVLGCKAIVVPIDDVDMALDNAFSVLDEVRKLLSCPYIIPVVSGDNTLYTQMITLHFDKLSAPYKANQQLKEEGVEIATNLCSSYLTKVFPNNFRLPLLTIDGLLPRLNIITRNKKKLTFDEYKTSLTNYFFHLCNGEEKSKDFPLPSNAREAVQLIQSLPPLDQSNLVNKDKTAILWRNLKTWAAQKEHGACYSNADSVTEILEFNDRSDSKEIFRFDQLLAFNPILQAKEKLDWATNTFFEDQVEGIKELSKSTSYLGQLKVINSFISKKIFIPSSMPMLEMVIPQLRITQDNVVKYESLKDKLLLAIYTHSDYYSNLDAKAHNVFFSRAFEVLAVSILSVTNLLETGIDECSKKEFWKRQLKDIFNRTPFYSIHAINPTKCFEEDDTDDVSSADDELSTLSDSEFQTFISEITTWQENSIKIIGTKKYENVLPLVHSVFNKVFTQLHLFRKEIVKAENSVQYKAWIYSDEHLTDSARRFEYLVINAFASFIGKKDIIQANTAIKTKIASLRNGSFNNTTLAKNIKNFGEIRDWEELKEYNGKEEINKIWEADSNTNTLLEIIWNHPIFVYLNKSRKPHHSDDPKFKVATKKGGNPSSNNNTENKKKNMDEQLGEIVEIILSLRKPNTSGRLTHNEIKQWITKDKQKAKNFWESILKFLKNKAFEELGYSKRSVNLAIITDLKNEFGDN
jgi:hypothetical protein